MRTITWHKLVSLIVPVLLNIFSPLAAAALETFVLTGRIMDIDSKPVAGAELFVYDSAVTRRPADFISARSGQDGRYSLTLPRQKFWAVARVRSGDKFGPLLPDDRHSGEALLIETDDAVTLRQDFTVVNIREAVRQKQKVRSDYQYITGRILDQNGKPASNSYVFALAAQIVNGIPEYISAWSDDSGKYTLYLPPGRYFLGASTIFPPPPGTATSRSQAVASGHNAVAIDIKLPL